MNFSHSHWLRLTVAIAALGAAPLAYSDAFLKIDRLSGESQVAGHVGEFMLLGVSWSAGAPSVPTATGRSETGKLNDAPLHVTLALDSRAFGSAWMAVQNNADLGSATLTVSELPPGARPTNQVQIVMSHARISRIEIGDSGNKATMTWLLIYSGLTVVTPNSGAASTGSVTGAATGVSDASYAGANASAGNLNGRQVGTLGSPTIQQQHPTTTPPLAQPANYRAEAVAGTGVRFANVTALAGSGAVNCPAPIELQADLYFSGPPRLASYRWVLSDGQSTPPRQVNTGARAPLHLADRWSLGTPGRAADGWAQLEISNQPQQTALQLSPQTKFHLQCR
ncbi:MAG: type VI secretion system tube protein Hcp [Steroidobacteraceae bacterium]